MHYHALQLSDYLQERGDMRGVSRVALRRVEHLYYKTDAVYDAMRRMAMAQQESHQAGEAPAADAVEAKAEEEGADLGEEDEPVDEAAVSYCSKHRAICQPMFCTGTTAVHQLSLLEQHEAQAPPEVPLLPVTCALCCFRSAMPRMLL